MGSPRNTLFNVNCFSSPFSYEGACYNPLVDAVYMPVLQDEHERSLNMALELAHRSLQNRLRCLMRFAAARVYRGIEQLSDSNDVIIDTCPWNIPPDAPEDVKYMPIFNRMLDLLCVASEPVEEIWSLLYAMHMLSHDNSKDRSTILKRWENIALDNLHNKMSMFNVDLYHKLRAIVRNNGISVARLMALYALNGPPPLAEDIHPSVTIVELFNKYEEYLSKPTWSPIMRLEYITDVFSNRHHDLRSTSDVLKYIGRAVNCVPWQDANWAECCNIPRRDGCEVIRKMMVWRIPGSNGWNNMDNKYEMVFHALSRKIGSEGRHTIPYPFMHEESAPEYVPTFEELRPHLYFSGDKLQHRVHNIDGYGDMIIAESVRQQFINGGELSCPFRVNDKCIDKDTYVNSDECAFRSMLEKVWRASRPNKMERWPMLGDC